MVHNADSKLQHLLFENCYFKFKVEFFFLTLFLFDCSCMQIRCTYSCPKQLGLQCAPNDSHLKLGNFTSSLLVQWLVLPSSELKQKQKG